MSASRSVSPSSVAARPGLATANRLLQLLADDPETLERLGEVPVAVIEKAKVCGGHNLSGAVVRPGAAGGAVPRPDARGLAQGGLRLRRGAQGGRLPHAQRERLAADPDAAAVQEPRQRGHLGLGAGPLPAATGRGGRRVRPDRDRGHAAARRGRPRQAASAPATRAAARTASRWATSSPAPTSPRSSRCWPRAAGATSPVAAIREFDLGRGPRAPGLGARGQGGLEGPQAAGPPDPHDRARGR